MSDQDRVETVYRSVHPRLWRSLLSYTGDADVASDVEAEAFAQVLWRGDAVDDVAAWVWRIAFRIASGLLAARSSSNDVRLAEGPTSPSGSVAEFLGLLADLSPQQRPASRCGTSASTRHPRSPCCSGPVRAVRVQLYPAHAALRHTIMEAEHA